MEDVLDLYAEPACPERPVVCFDESPVQLVEEVRQPVGAEPGRPERVDYEDKRNGTGNVFIAVEPQVGLRHVTVTERRTKQDFALQMKALVDERYPQADVIRLVLDNLNTHTPAALYEAFTPEEARRITRTLESTTRPSTLAGSTWPRSNWQCSPASVLTDGSPTPTTCAMRRVPGSRSATTTESSFTGASPLPTPESSSSAFTMSNHRDRPLSRSQEESCIVQAARRRAAAGVSSAK